jgi:transcriptional regulator GlxA family with amidase domain
VGPLDVFTSANRAVGGKPLYDLQIVSAEKARPDGKIAGMCGLSLHCQNDFHTFSGEIDTLLVPGGIGVEEKNPDPAAVEWLRRAAAGSRRIGSICTGTFLLAYTGLLDGRRVTTHWAFASELARRYPKVNVKPDPIWIQDDQFYTSAGVTAGIDLCLALLEEDHGAAPAWKSRAFSWCSFGDPAIKPNSVSPSPPKQENGSRCTSYESGWPSI